MKKNGKVAIKALDARKASKPGEILKAIEKNRGAMEKFRVKKIGLFGSYAKGRQGRKSDIDFIVAFEKPTFDNYMNLKFMLEKMFGRKVDLVMESSIKPAMGYVKGEALYAKRL